jgi:hypothetical protein
VINPKMQEARAVLHFRELNSSKELGTWEGMPSYMYIYIYIYLSLAHTILFFGYTGSPKTKTKDKTN